MPAQLISDGRNLGWPLAALAGQPVCHGVERGVASPTARPKLRVKGLTTRRPRRFSARLPAEGGRVDGSGRRRLPALRPLAGIWRRSRPRRARKRAREK